MTTRLPGPLVSTEWLARHLADPDVVVVDGSWYLPAMNRDPREEYLAAHVPGAIFFDLDAFSDERTPLPHMFPPPETAAARLGAAGISRDHRIVLYDGSGSNLSAPRFWWQLRLLGHDQVAVLDGGFQKWRAEGRPVESGEVTRSATTFRADFRPELIADAEQVRGLVGDPEVVLVDARSAGRFEGREPEPRPGLRGGHIPGARNVPYGRVVDADGTMLPPAQLAQRFADAGVDLERRIVTSCGSGVSACAVALALEVLGHRRYAVYDGSWAEWGGREDLPVATGR